MMSTWARRLPWMLAFVVLLAGVAIVMSPEIPQAQTADDSTPAEKTVCSDLGGAAFGLCNAYCEAMDCDSMAPEASDKACDRVFSNFVNITGSEPPCEAPLPIDCVVSELICGECIGECGGHLGTQTCEREILVQPENGGAPCPPLREVRECRTDPCPMCIPPGRVCVDAEEPCCEGVCQDDTGRCPE